MNICLSGILTVMLIVTNLLISFLALIAWNWSIKEEGKMYAFEKESIPITLGMVLLFLVLSIKQVPFSIVRAMSVWVLFIIYLPMVASDIQTHTIPKRYAIAFPILASATIAVYQQSLQFGMMTVLMFLLTIILVTIAALFLYEIPSVFNGFGYADFVGFAEMITLGFALRVEPVMLCISLIVLSLCALLFGNRKKGYAFVPVLLLAVPLGMLMGYMI
ncbi:MAG: hypothetical protein Q4B60_05260 [Erysipelotrichaceae bacterium]|nr:hypothetical protein [Erysipelotrichaceae bacterium]